MAEPPPRVSSVDPLRGVEFWYEGGRRIKGQEHLLDPDSAVEYDSR